MTERIIAQRLGIGLPQVQGTVRLLREGATIPFISRYRKEATGSLDELQVGAIKEQLDRLTELEARRQTVLTTIEGQGKLTGELRKRIEECWNAVELEDIYLPYKPKRRTRATAARERGLEPLADIVMAQRAHDLLRQAQRFVTAGVATPEEAIAGACDIVAERISEDEQARNTVRRTMGREGAVHSKLVKGKEAEGAKYSDYFDAASPLRSISSHRFLAMRRGEDEGILRISVDADTERITEALCRRFIRPGSATRTYMEAAVADSLKRLIRPSIETELLAAAKEKADDEAIGVFAENLRQLLLSAPLGQKRVIAIDPGFRRAAKSSSWTRRATSCTIRPSTRTRRRAAMPKRRKRCGRWRGNTGPRPSQSATVRRGAKPSSWCAAWDWTEPWRYSWSARTAHRSTRRRPRRARSFPITT